MTGYVKLSRVQMLTKLQFEYYKKRYNIVGKLVS